MKRSICSITALAASILVLTGCGGSSGSSNTAAVAPASVLQSSIDDSDYHTILSCPDGQQSLDLPIGKTTQADGESFSLTETRNAINADSDPGIQTSATLKIKLGSRDSVRFVIVHSDDPGSSFTDAANDQPLSVQIGQNGTGQYLLQSNAYGHAPGLGTGNITSVTICLNQSAPSHTPAPSSSTSS